MNGGNPTFDNSLNSSPPRCNQVCENQSQKKKKMTLKNLCTEFGSLITKNFETSLNYVRKLTNISSVMFSSRVRNNFAHRRCICDKTTSRTISSICSRYFEACTSVTANCGNVDTERTRSYNRSIDPTQKILKLSFSEII